ncbi:MAG: hypothetical protein WCQ54_09605 [Clostridiaceae bacterium]
MKRIISYLSALTIIFLVGCSYNPINSKNSVEQQSKSEKNISFNCFYAGFVLEKDMFELPRGIVLLNNESEWKAFKDKYFSKSSDMNYRELPEDFTKQSIIYYSILSPNPTIFSKAFQIDKFQISNNKLSIITKELDNIEVTVPNHDSSMHRFVILAAVNKSDILKVNIPSEQGINDKWKSVDRLRYIQGKIVSLKKISDGKSILSLKIEKNFHDGTDPVGNPDYPFKIGQVVELFLNSQPKIDLAKIKRVIVYESDVTADDNDSFVGASIKYYESDGKFFDMDGKQISLPPTQYPNTF